MSITKTSRVASLIVVLLIVGCQQQANRPSPSLFAPLETLLGLSPPVRLGVTEIHINPFVPPPWQPLQEQLKRILGRDVQVLQLKPFQICAKLSLGQLDFAMVSAGDYLEIGGQPTCRILAVPVNPDLSMQKHALIVTADNSGLQSLDQLKGRRFAFGPANDPLLHIAPVDALIQAGVNIDQLTKEILPPFGFHISSHEAAKAALYGGVQAAVVDEQEFTSWPEQVSGLFKTALPRGSFRVLAKTKPVPNGPFLAGSKTDPQMVERVRTFLLEESANQPELLKALGIGGFRQGSPELYEPFKEMMARVKPQLPKQRFILPPASPSQKATAEESRS